MYGSVAKLIAALGGQKCPGAAPPSGICVAKNKMGNIGNILSAIVVLDNTRTKGINGNPRPHLAEIPSPEYNPMRCPKSSWPKINHTDVRPSTQQIDITAPASVKPTPGNISLEAAPSTAFTPSTTKLRGRAIVISDLHCGHCILGNAPVRFRDEGASRSATQSSRQDSCAVSAQGHGDRQAEEVGVSSVSSAKHIQHLRG